MPTSLRSYDVRSKRSMYPRTVDERARITDHGRDLNYYFIFVYVLFPSGACAYRDDSQRDTEKNLQSLSISIYKIYSFIYI